MLSLRAFTMKEEIETVYVQENLNCSTALISLKPPQDLN